MAKPGNKPPSDTQDAAKESTQNSGPVAGAGETGELVLPPEIVGEAVSRGKPLRVSLAAVYAGPLPPPSLLREYDEFSPGFSQAILEEFRHEARHRRLLERAG